MWPGPEARELRGRGAGPQGPALLSGLSHPCVSDHSHTSSGRSGLRATRSRSLQRNSEQGRDNQEGLGHTAPKKPVFVAMATSPSDEVLVHSERSRMVWV